MNAPDRRPRATWPFRLWLVNLALGTLVGARWLSHAPPDMGLAAWGFARLALVSTVLVLSLAPYVVLRLATFWMPVRLACGIAAVGWTAFQLALYADTVIYDLFRYHFNGMVWNVLSGPDTGDSVQLARGDWLVAGAGTLAVLAALATLAFWLAGRDARRRVDDPVRPRLLRPLPVWGLFLLPVVVGEKALFAWADLERDTAVTAQARLFPLYQKLSVKTFAEEVLAVDLAARERVEVRKGGVLLAYPREPLAAPPDGPRPNILIVVIDSLRADVLDAETMPHLERFAARGRRFADHVSGGNATRFGLFSLIYGLHGPYWFQIYEEKCSPVLVDVLLEAGYDTGVFSTASMSSPEFRSTAWVRIEDDVRDDIKGKGKHRKDARLAEDLLEWVGTRAGAAERRPFFAFALLDSPHQRYSFPEDDPPFTPYAEDVGYLALAGGLTPEKLAPLWNSYRNAVRHADSVTHRILSGLEELGVLEDTLVLVTGDHGEEFGESGFFGHTSNFTREQIQVPLVLAGPGVTPGVETTPTSHIDVPATLLEALGLDRASRASYTLGGSLLDPEGRGMRVASGWDTLGLWHADAILVVPFEAYEGLTSVYDHRWRPVADEARVRAAAQPALVRLVTECARFLR